jgi:hypothetical protein
MQSHNKIHLITTIRFSLVIAATSSTTSRNNFFNNALRHRYAHTKVDV